MKKRTRRLKICHIKDELKDSFARWSKTWCGKLSFLEHDFKSTPKDEKRLDVQQAKNERREWFHCPKCVKHMADQALKRIEEVGSE